MRPIYHLCEILSVQIRQLRVVQRTLTDDATKTLVRIFITSHIDYCNSVFSGANSIHIRPLQSILHSAARLIARRRKYGSNTPTIRDILHRLPIPQRIIYKLYLSQHFRCDLTSARRLAVNCRFLSGTWKHLTSAIVAFLHLSHAILYRSLLKNMN